MASATISRRVKDELRAALLNELEAAWLHARKLHPDHTPYAFVLYGVEGAVELSPQVMTEQGLTAVAKRYVKKGMDDTLEDARKSLRYSVADLPSFEDLMGDLQTVNALARQHLTGLSEEEGYKVLAGVAMEALADLDRSGLFGRGQARRRLLLYIVTEDTETDWPEVSAKRLNPKVVYQRFARETRIKGHYAECDAMALSPDGKTIYATGSGSAKRTQETDDDDDSESQVIRFDLQGRRVRRRWTFSFPMFGDSAQHVVCAPDGKAVYVLRRKYVSRGKGDERQAVFMLMRFVPGQKKPVISEMFDGEAFGLAVSPDGSLLATIVERGCLQLFTSDLRSKGECRLPGEPTAVKFLPSGELLLACGRLLVRVEAKTARIRARVKVRANQIAMDRQGTLVAVSHWAPDEGPGAKREIGVTLLRLPSLKVTGTFMIKKHQASSPTISPDGRLLAMEAHEVGTYRKFLAVFDTRTGRQIARRKVDSANAFIFLADSRTLAIGVSAYVTDEPVIFWKLPAD